MSYIYYIKSINEIGENDEPLYWSNTWGWVDKQSADFFNSEEAINLFLPIGGRWEKLNYINNERH